VTGTDAAALKDAVRQTVRTLFEAENGSTRQVADRILASDYLPIVRGRGQVDGDREDTLRKIAAGSPGFVRHVDRAEIQVDLFLDDRVAIARSLLLTTDSRTSPIVEASYRNLQVFLRAGDAWQCIAWQVTRVQ
jgi:hypothetical protein